MKFTESAVKAFKAPADKEDHYEWDEAMPGFGLRCQSGGRKVYLVKYRVGDKQRKQTLGATNKVTLETVRANARIIFGKVAMGIDPANERARAATDASRTFDAIIEGYLETVASERSKSHYDATQRALKVKFKSAIDILLQSIEALCIANDVVLDALCKAAVQLTSRQCLQD